jgi:hypothetical protein
MPPLSFLHFNENIRIKKKNEGKTGTAGENVPELSRGKMSIYST